MAVANMAREELEQKVALLRDQIAGMAEKHQEQLEELQLQIKELVAANIAVNSAAAENQAKWERARRSASVSIMVTFCSF